MTLKLLLIVDVHYTGSVLHEGKIPARKAKYGLELIKRVKRTSSPGCFDPVIFMGDAFDNGLAEGVEADFRKTKEEFCSFGPPSYLSRGNHDCPKNVFIKILSQQPDCAIIGDHLLYFFHDSCLDGDLFACFQEEFRKFQAVTERYSGKRIIAFQHDLIFAGDRRALSLQH